MNKIEKLNDIIDSNAEKREYDRYRKERDTERQRTIDEAPSSKVTGFFCTECNRDFNALGHKQVIETYQVAKYEAKCPKGHLCIRRITDRMTDPYFDLSRTVKEQRAIAGDDLLQPGDPRFESVWGWKARQKRDKEGEANERDEWLRRRG